MQANHIAVSTDFSDDSRGAIPVAASLARAFQADLLVVHQAMVPPALAEIEKRRRSSPRTGQLHGVLDSLQGRLDEMVRKEPGMSDVHGSCRLVRSSNVEAFVECLQSEGISLLVLAPHGARGSDPFFLGSFAEKALRAATCPVLVCRSSGRGCLPQGEFSPRRILVASDLSRGSFPGLILAAVWARRFGSTLRLLSVVEKTPARFGYSEGIFDGWYEYLRETQEEIHRKLESAIQDYGLGAEIQKRVTLGEPVQEILAEADRYEPDVIVMGSHGRAGLEDFLLGSVTRKVTALAPCPVLLARSEELKG